MKTIILTTIGSTGDVIPYLALARGLAALGHKVRVASHAFHRDRFERIGIEFVPVGGEFLVESFNRMMDDISLIRAPLRQYEALVDRLFLKDADRQFTDHLAVSKQADVVVAHRFDYVAQEAAIRNGVPWISVTLMPMVLRTSLAPVYPFPDFGAWWTEFTWAFLERIARPMNAHISDVLREKFEAPKRPLQVAGALSPYLNLIAASAHIVEPRSDWPPTVHLTGPWVHEEPAYEPEPQLTDFLEAHGPPVVVSFGSMGGSREEPTTTLLLEALAKVARPAIIQGGYSGLLRRGAQNDRTLSVGYVPHEFLFSRASCVVHHAGAGTATSACRSGAPSVPVPHLFDQYYWAGMLHDRGVAPKPLFRRNLSSKRLAERIEAAMSREMKARAEKLGESIREERGVDVAIAHIERFMAGEV